MAEAGFGVALVNDRTYGHDVSRTAKATGGTYTTVRASLLRAPRFPDPGTDHGSHRFRHALVAGADIAEAIREGYRFNLPARRTHGASTVPPLVTVSNDAVIPEAVKLADDGSGDVVIRLYEALGGRAACTVTASFPIQRARCTELLERDRTTPEEHDVAGNQVSLALRPFQIRTLRLRRA